MKTDYEYINELKKVIDNNKDKRICVVGTSCTGKTTYLPMGTCQWGRANGDVED